MIPLNQLLEGLNLGVSDVLSFTECLTAFIQCSTSFIMMPLHRLELVLEVDPVVLPFNFSELHCQSFIELLERSYAVVKSLNRCEHI